MKNYFIKKGYTPNLRSVPYIDTEEAARIWQVEVYKYAAAIISLSDSPSVLDLGCGIGLKLKEYILPLTSDITGIDRKSIISQNSLRYKFGSWIADDFESPYTEGLARQFDFIICSDVIEHLKDPDHLLSYIRKCGHRNTKVILSTPERDLRRGVRHTGPPQNNTHVREWNKKELSAYITESGFHIVDHRIVESRVGLETCQLILCFIR